MKEIKKEVELSKLMVTEQMFNAIERARAARAHMTRAQWIRVAIQDALTNQGVSID